MNDEWRTPLDLFKVVDEEFHFQFDLCTDGSNSLCKEYSTDIVDHLTNEMHFDSY